MSYESFIDVSEAWSLSHQELREILKQRRPIHNLEWSFELVLTQELLKKLPESTHILIQRGVLECNHSTISALNMIYRDELILAEQTLARHLNRERALRIVGVDRSFDAERRR